MIGVDLGLNVGSITRIDKEGRVKDSLVFKFTDEKEIKDEQKRLFKIAWRFAKEILSHPDQWVALEEPVFSWGRKNPKGFSKNVAVLWLVHYMLWNHGHKGKILWINNKTAKRLAGGGGKDKAAMIAAFKKKTGNFPGHSTKYGQETLADSYFIALAGYET